MLLCIKGKVDDLRLQRLNAWKIVEGFRGSKEMPELVDFYPLPYDEELVGYDKKISREALEDYYKTASSELVNFTWPSKN